MRVLIDMNLSPLWVSFFAGAGIEAVHWSTVGDPRAADRTIMQWALDNQYVVFTNDLDFGALLAATQAQLPSVVQVRTQDVLPEAIGSLVVSALRQCKSQLEAGALMTIDQARLRVRMLPIGETHP